MGVAQVYRGNPELKQVFQTSGFTGGMNVTRADDLIPNSVMRSLVNIDCDIQGELSTRKGFGRNNALSGLLYPANTYRNSSVNFITQKQVFFTLLRNDNAAWQRLSDCTDIAEFIANYGTGNILRYLNLMVHTSGDLLWEDVSLTIASPVVNVTRTGFLSSADFHKYDFLTNWESIDKYGRLYFTNNDKGLLIFDAASATPTDPWTYVGAFTAKTNSAYKPNGIEVRKVGFNVLGTSPLSWVSIQSILTESIQGVFLTTVDRKPIQVIPSGETFQINILYTGTAHAFTIELLEGGEALEIVVASNATYTTSGLQVYDVSLKTQPTDEVEMVITYTDTNITIEPYYDYYYTGQVPGDAKAVTQLNLGEFKMVEMYERALYYKGNALWFSEIARFDYVPNYNFVLLPIDSTDEIMRVIFFRTSYIIFTKRRIYKLTGEFGAASMSLELVNENIGCISPRTPMVIGNSMFFVSTQGLRALVSDTFKENLENIKEIDEAISPIVRTSEWVQSIYYKDQYILMQNLKGVKYVKDINFRKYKVPDTLRYYYKMGAFVTDEVSVEAKFVFLENGELYAMTPYAIYRQGDAYSDFGENYESVIETAGISFGYPAHEKKIKSIVLKAGGGISEQPLIVQVAADGEIVVNTDMMPVSEINGVLTYEPNNPKIPMSDSLTTVLGSGVYNYHTKKLRLGARGKNIALRIRVNSTDRLTIQSIGYIYKLGKIKE